MSGHSYYLYLFMCVPLIESRSRNMPTPISNEPTFNCDVGDNKAKAIASHKPVKTRQGPIGTITLELGIFVDIHLKKKFGGNHKLKNYVKTLIRGTQVVFRYPTLRNKVNLQVNSYTYVSTTDVKRELNSETYLDNFCRWHYKKYWENKPRTYDLALFLFKQNMYSKYNINIIAEGVAKLDNVCYPSNSDNACAMVNISFVDAMWHIAHEIMHTFGVLHLTTQTCGGTSGVMSPHGSGHFKWANCTNDAFDAFLASQNSFCLFSFSGVPITSEDWNLNISPFHSLTRGQQCALAFGPKYRPFEFYNDLCYYLFCEYDLLSNIRTNSPLEETECQHKTLGPGKCIRGECVPNNNG